MGIGASTNQPERRIANGDGAVESAEKAKCGRRNSGKAKAERKEPRMTMKSIDVVEKAKCWRQSSGKAKAEQPMRT